jgi:hypothetical protein
VAQSRPLPSGHSVEAAAGLHVSRLAGVGGLPGCLVLGTAPGEWFFFSSLFTVSPLCHLFSLSVSHVSLCFSLTVSLTVPHCVSLNMSLTQAKAKVESDRGGRRGPTPKGKAGSTAAATQPAVFTVRIVPRALRPMHGRTVCGAENWLRERERERERVWAHTGGGKALAFKAPPMRPADAIAIEYPKGPC